jgi:GNAT superfamily N-acetyltransferase
MAWRRSRREFEAGKGEGNRRALKRLADGAVPPGLLLYEGATAVGCCSVAPREQFPRLAASRVWSPVDDAKVWSVSCFFVKKEHRNRGFSVRLLRAAIEMAAAHGARIVEGYPVEPSGRLPDPFVWTGLAASYRRAGFTEVARRSPSKPIVRYRI